MSRRFIYAQVDVELRDHERITGALLHDVPPEFRPGMTTGSFLARTSVGEKQRFTEWRK